MTQVGSNTQPIARFEGAGAYERAQQRAATENGSEVIVREVNKDGTEIYALYGLTDNQVRGYSTSELTPNVMAFSIVGEDGAEHVLTPAAFHREQFSQNISEARTYIQSFTMDDVEQLLPVPEEARPRLDEMAKTLGFRDFTVMQYQLRNLPTERVDALLTQMAQVSQQDLAPEDFDRAVDAAFSTWMQEEVQQMFRQADPPLPVPEFRVSETNRGENTRWNGSAVLAIYNGISELKERDQTGSMLGLLANNNGHPPLAFERAQARELGHYGGKDGHISLMDMLTSSMEVSYVNTTQGKIVLHDAGVSGQEAGIIRDAITSKINIINREEPIYTPAERQAVNDRLQEDGLNLNNPHLATRALKESYLQDYGLESLVQATNFVLRYRGLQDMVIDTGSQSLHEALQDPQQQERIQQELFQVLDRLGVQRLQEIAFKTEQVDAVRSLQEMINISRPEGQKIEVDGLYQQGTREAVGRFQMEQMMGFFKERIEDDPNLTPEVKQQYLQAFAEQFQALASGVSVATVLENTRGLMSGFIQEQGDSISPATRSRIESELSRLDTFVDGDFDSRTIAFLIDNWIDIMDTGGSVDFTEQLMTHEMAHTLQEQPGVMENWRQISWQSQEFELKNSMGVTFLADRNDHTHQHEGFASDYARVNEHEDFAESVRVFVYQPERLLEHSLTKFLFINSMLNTYNASEIISMAERVGYSRDELQTIVRDILGQQNPGNVVSRELQELQAGIMDQARISAYTKTLGGSLAPPNLSFSGATVALQAAQRFKFAPQTANSMATGMAKELLDPATSLSLQPNQPGWTLEYLTEQHRIVAGSGSPEEKQAAEARLQQFIDTGLESLPEEAQAQIPQEIRSQLNNPQNRAVYVTLARILGTGRALTDYQQLQESDQQDYAQGGWFNNLRRLTVQSFPSLDPEGVQITALNQTFDRLRENPDALREMVGESVYNELPEAFLVMLSEPGFVDSITGERGQAVLGPELISEYTFGEIARRSQNSGESYIYSAIKSVTLGLIGALYKDAVPSQSVDMAWQQVSKATQQHNQGSLEQTNKISKEEFSSLVQEDFMQNVQTILRDPENPERLRQIKELNPDERQQVQQEVSKLQGQLFTNLGIS